MRLKLIGLFAAAGLAMFTAGCANRTGDQTISEWCAAEAGRANTDICKQHADTEDVRRTLGDRISDVFSRTERAQATADEALARNLACQTSTLNNRQVGSCSDSTQTLTSCVQTRYTTRAGGLSILRSINDTECRFNTRVLEMQVRCCHVGAEIADSTTVDQPAPREEEAAPPPVS